jgi:hypothetical protein
MTAATGRMVCMALEYHRIYSSASSPESTVRSRPALRIDSRNTNSICAFKLRRSSFAQRCIASSVLVSIRNANDFLAATGDSRSGVQRAGIQYWLCTLIATENNQKVANHRGLPFFVQSHDVFLSQFIQR